MMEGLAFGFIVNLAYVFRVFTSIAHVNSFKCTFHDTMIY